MRRSRPETWMLSGAAAAKRRNAQQTFEPEVSQALMRGACGPVGSAHATAENANDTSNRATNARSWRDIRDLPILEFEG